MNPCTPGSKTPIETPAGCLGSINNGSAVERPPGTLFAKTDPARGVSFYQDSWEILPRVQAPAGGAVRPTSAKAIVVYKLSGLLGKIEISSVEMARNGIETAPEGVRTVGLPEGGRKAFANSYPPRFTLSRVFSRLYIVLYYYSIVHFQAGKCFSCLFWHGSFIYRYKIHSIKPVFPPRWGVHCL